MSWKTCFFIVCCFLILAYPYSIFSNHNVFFGVLILVYFISQMGLATRNYLSMKSLTIGQDGAPDVVLMVVGYRENPDYWRACLESIRTIDYPSIRGVHAFVDGDEEEDRYMTTIFNDVFLGEYESARSRSIHLLPHRGKRHAMADGFRRIRDTHPDNPYIIVIDSDTILEKDSVRRLVACIHESDNIGCATGNIQIFNTKTILSKIVNARYAYAFTIERSAMSAVGVMNCCSGPFSIYRQSLLDEQFIDDFVHQTFCGKEVGPGDDRHATLLLMNRGYQSKQNPFAIVYTETPESLHRYFQQQLRWMRSFYREQFWQVSAIPKQNIYLAIITAYELFFPFLILVSFFPTFRLIDTSMSNRIFFQRVAVAISVIFIRTFFLLGFNRMQLSSLWNIFVFPVYFLFLLPIKIYGLLTCGVQSWITSSRKTIFTTLNPDIFMIYTSIIGWNALLIYCACHLFLPMKSIHLPKLPWFSSS